MARQGYQPDKSTLDVTSPPGGGVTDPVKASRPPAIEFADVVEAVGMGDLIGGAEQTLTATVYIKEINNRVSLLEAAIYQYCPDTSWRRDALRDLYNSAAAARFAIRNPEVK